MASQDASELVIAGTGDIYIGPYGTTLPTTEATATAGFDKVGYTSTDGVTFNASPTVNEFYAWQSKRPVRREMTALDVTLAFAMEQWNSTNLTAALGGGAVTQVSSGHFKYSLPADSDTLDEVSVIADCIDGSEIWRFVFPKASISEAVEISLNRENLALLPVTFKAVGSSSDTPYILTNSTAVTAHS